MINNSKYGDVPMPENIFGSDSESDTSESDTTECVTLTFDYVHMT